MNEKIKFRNNAEYIVPFIIENKSISKYVKEYDVIKLSNNMLIKASLKDKSKDVLKEISKDSSFDHTYKTRSGIVAIFIVPKNVLYLCNIFYISGESAYNKDMLKDYYLYWNNL